MEVWLGYPSRSIEHGIERHLRIAIWTGGWSLSGCSHSRGTRRHRRRCPLSSSWGHLQLTEEKVKESISLIENPQRQREIETTKTHKSVQQNYETETILLAKSLWLNRTTLSQKQTLIEQLWDVEEPLVWMLYNQNNKGRENKQNKRDRDKTERNWNPKKQRQL